MVDRYKPDVSNVQITAHMVAMPSGHYVKASDYDALAARYRHVLSVMRRDGYWSAVMTDAEVDAQVDEDIARAAATPRENENAR